MIVDEVPSMREVLATERFPTVAVGSGDEALAEGLRPCVVLLTHR
jgi:hypothetical protein